MDANTAEGDSPKAKVKQLESELGVSILEDDRNVATLKDPMRETKNTFMRNQKQASEFVSKLQSQKKEFEQVKRQLEKKELEKYRKIESSRKLAQEERQEKIKEIKEKKRQEIMERKEQEREIKAKRDEEWKKFRQKQKTNKYMHEKLEEDYNNKVLMPELEKK